MELKFDERGLIPVITQDVKTKEVLMLAYANREAVELTLKTGYAHYWSRSRKKLWKKGESSGNVQKVVEVRYDCDCDALLYLVEQRGNACHTGNYSCFYRRLDHEVRC
ncbi:phosphoribosyl-AMP cyclohydrolase [Archaeoglobus neptunius]|uniref:phosphoribosyl-AMP cyclohydrolase n=1 Tax=Archaeoglobus neptunius TaxID=2798580 RepID=UPI0019287571|nr:phosphoribosyl-AMP cyclohydrolase [Archaeoglobus neptunius]